MAGKRANGEGSIYRQSDGRWVGAITVGRERKRFYGKARRDVAARLNDALRAQADGLPVLGNQLTTGRYLGDWLAALETSGSVRRSTYASYEYCCRLHLIPGLDRVPLARLTAAHVDRFLADKARAGASARTRKYLRTVLRIALNTAIRQGLALRNAAALSTAPRVDRPHIQPFTPEEAVEFVVAVRGERLEALWLTVLGLGLREGEALALTRADLDLAHTVLHVRHNLTRFDGVYRREAVKTDRSRRTLQLGGTVAAALQAHLDRARWERERAEALGAWQGNEWDLLFTTETGRPLHYATVNHMFHRLLVKAGLPARHFYTLRHSAASLLIAQGADLHDVKNQLGHSTITLTSDTYAHIYDARKRELAAGMDAFLAGIRPAAEQK